MGLEVAALGLGLIGSGISAYSTYQQGQAQQAMANRNADIADANAKNDALTAAENVKRQRERNQRALSSVRSRMAGAGVQLSTGSSLDTIGEMASELELQTMDLFNESRARQVQFANESSIQRWQGKQASMAGKIGAIGTLIGGAGQAISGYSDLKQNGILRTGTP